MWRTYKYLGMAQPNFTLYIILAMLRFCGVFVNISFILQTKKRRFSLLIIGWTFWGLSPLLHLIEEIHPLFLMLLYGLTAFIGTYFVIFGILREFSVIPYKRIFSIFIILCISFAASYFILPSGSFFIMLIMFQAVLVDIGLLFGVFNWRKIKKIGGSWSLIWFSLIAVISAIQTFVFLMIPDFTSYEISFGINYFIIFIVNIFVMTVEQNIIRTEIKNVQAKYLQSQKMEAIGSFAGGIAHDFNNLLTVINGISELHLNSSELSVLDMPITALNSSEISEFLDKCQAKLSNFREDMTEINLAGSRAAELTRNLLAFSRKQIFQTRTLNLNDLVESMKNMLRRLIGEDISFQILYDEKLGNVLCDPSQVEQVLMNLVVNARDAMPKGGNLLIETQNISVDSKDHLSFNPPGEYASIIVSDTGIGMSKEQMAHIFEPYYTTKSQGKGTGLGLSTVFGIMKQSKGEVTVYSQKGYGSTFKLYFPITSKKIIPIQKKLSPKAQNYRGSQTIWIVEDEDLVRTFIEKILTSYGYNIISHSSPTQALNYLMSSKKNPHILLTDVVMPEMSGKELADRFLQQSPGLKIIFASGFTEQAIVEKGILIEGINFLPKPFSAIQLLQKIKEVSNFL